MKRLNLEYLQPKTAKGYTYYAIPKPLIDDPVFDGIDLEAKFLYCQMVERVALSASHADDYMDEDGKLYIIYTVEEVMQARRCSKSTAVKWIDQLDKLGLIEKRRRGQGKPTIIYVKDFVSALSSSEVETLQPAEPSEESPLEDLPESFSEQPQDKVFEGGCTSKSRSSKNGLLEVQKVDFLKSKNWTSRSLENEPLEVQKVDPINKDLREKDLRENLSSSSEEEEKLTAGEFLELEQEVKEQIQFEYLLDARPEDRELIGSIVDLLVEIKCHNGPVKIGSMVIPYVLLQKRLWSLDVNHIEHVLVKIKTAKDVHSPKAYLLTLLYNAPVEMDFADQVSVNKYLDDSG